MRWTAPTTAIQTPARNRQPWSRQRQLSRHRGHGGVRAPLAGAQQRQALRARLGRAGIRGSGTGSGTHAWATASAGAERSARSVAFDASAAQRRRPALRMANRSRQQQVFPLPLRIARAARPPARAWHSGLARAALPPPRAVRQLGLRETFRGAHRPRHGRAPPPSAARPLLGGGATGWTGRPARRVICRAARRGRQARRPPDLCDPGNRLRRHCGCRARGPGPARTRGGRQRRKRAGQQSAPGLRPCPRKAGWGARGGASATTAAN